MLGIFFAPDGNSKQHIRQMCKKGFDWADRLATKPLPMADAWLSFCFQVYPGMSWGFMTTVVPPKILADEVHRVLYKSLPLLGVHRNIKKELCMLPERFQGLGLPNFVVILFACKVFSCFLIGGSRMLYCN